MCGRYSLLTDPEDIAAAIAAEVKILFDPRYDVRPGSTAPVVVQTERGRSVQGFRWGLVPSWAKEEKIGYRMINARSETVREKPSFRSLVPRRRCLVPADGFYEWVGPKGGKERHWIYLENRALFFMAGLWDRWVAGSNRTPLFTFTILTTQANELVAPIHDRMPVILGPEEREAWIDPASDPDRLDGLLHPFSALRMDTQTVANDLSDVVPEDWREPEGVRPTVGDENE